MVTLTLTNPHLTDARDTEIVLRGGATATAVDATVLTADDVHDHNTFEQPNVVAAKGSTASANGKVVKFTIPPSSVAKLAITLN